MPQMAPIGWLSLFIMFFMIFILFNMMNYYSFYPTTPSHEQKNKNLFSMNWKW